MVNEGTEQRGGKARGRSSREHVVVVAAALLCLAVLLDCAGIALQSEVLWRTGGLLGWGALAGALPAAVYLIITRVGWLRAIALLIGLALFTLGRLLRGSAGVPPDPPILAAAITGTALFTVAVLLPSRRRSTK